MMYILWSFARFVAMVIKNELKLQYTSVVTVAAETVLMGCHLPAEGPSPELLLYPAGLAAVVQLCG